MMSQSQRLTAVPSPRALMDTPTTATKVGWRDRLHDPALTALLLIESLLTFVLVPLREIGIAGPPFITYALPLLLIAIVVLLSRTKGAVVLVLVSMALCIGGILLDLAQHSLATNLISTGGVLLARVALGWVIAAAVFAPGRITHYRVQGAIVLYINFGVTFAVLYRLIVQLSPGAITGLPAFSGDLGPMAQLVYFSFATLTTTGTATFYRCIRSLAALPIWKPSWALCILRPCSHGSSPLKSAIAGAPWICAILSDGSRLRGKDPERGGSGARGSMRVTAHHPATVVFRVDPVHF